MRSAGTRLKDDVWLLPRRLFCSPPSSRSCLSVLVLSRTTATPRRHAVPADGRKTGALSKPRGPVLTRPIPPEKVTHRDNVVALALFLI